MATKIQKRAVPPVMGTNFKPTLDGLFVSVNELSGAIGDNAQRAVRICELLDAGIISLDVDGALVKPGTGTGTTPSPGLYVEKAGDVMTGPITQANGATFLQTAAGAKILSGPAGNTLIIQAAIPAAGMLALRDSVGAVQYDFGPSSAAFAFPLGVAGTISASGVITGNVGFSGNGSGGILGDTGGVFFHPNGVGSVTARAYFNTAGTLLMGNGKDTIQSADTYLRLNNSGHYASGVYTPGTLLLGAGLTGTTVNMSSTITAGAAIQSTSGVIRSQGFGGDATSGVLYMGDAATDAYVYRPGGTQQINLKYGTGTGILNSAGTIFTTGNFNPATKLDYRASLDVYAATPASTDWNNANVNGWWMASAAANAPHAGWNIGNITVHNNDWIQQEVWDFTLNAGSTKYLRRKQAGAWGAWTFNQYFGDHIFVGKWGGGSNYGGVMSHNEKYLIMTGTSDANTYVGAKAGGEVVIRADDNDATKELKVGSTVVTPLNLLARDFTASRGDGTGVIFLNAANTRYLYWDATTYNLPGGPLLVGGVVTATNFTATSDERLKQDMLPVTPDRNLELLSLHTWNWRGSGNPGRGVLAQQVKILAPDYVHESADGMLSVDKAGLALELAMLALSRTQGHCHAAL